MSFVVALPVAAQEYVAAIKLGGAVTTLSGESDTSFDPHGGLAGGAAVGYDFGNGFLFQAEFLYVRKGVYADTELEFTDLEGNPIARTPIRARFDLSYLELPLLAVYRFENARLEPKLFVGPYVAYKLNAVVKYRALSGGPTQSEPDDSVEDFDYGAIAGVGTDFFVSGQRLSIDVRALFGQGNVRQSDPPLKFVGGALMLGIVF